jgi:release factor glutamine methyltransferase
VSQTGNKSGQVWTIQSVLAWSKGYLEKHGVDSPKLTAELLLSHALACTRMHLYLHLEQPLEGEELAAYRELLKRRAKREPTQYILGTQGFWSLDLLVDPRVLIPRPETECLVEECVRLFKEGVVPLQGPFLDVCTGSGALACALASEFRDAEVDATDVSPDALEVARANVERCEEASSISASQITLFEGDLFASLPAREYAVIVSNPPYIRSADMAGLQDEVRDFEPSLALDGGEDGLDLVREILDQAPSFLTEQGVLLIEIGSDQGEAALAEAQRRDAYASARILRDYSRLDRVLQCFVSPYEDEEAAG